MARQKIEVQVKKGRVPPEKPRVPKKEEPLAPPKKRRRTWPYAMVLIMIWALIVSGAFALHWMSELPDTSHLLVQKPSHDITIIDRNGARIARKGLVQGAMVASKDLPSYVPNAFIAIEDRRFRDHMGVDIIGTVRAALENMAAGHVVQGGSTITQQLAKNLFLDPKRTFDRKGQEALLALYLESRYSKDQILTLYLNRVYFGAGVYGIEAASERFFGKPAISLTLPEAAMLAGSVKAPAKYNPLADFEASQARAQVVLRAMKDAGFISENTRKMAAESPPRIARTTGTPGSGYFADWVVTQVPHYVGALDGPVVVKTTFDLALQRKAEHAVEAGLARDGRKLHAHQAALILLTPDGGVRAMVGGRSYGVSTYNRATDAKRQPGSAFKPFVYLTALEHGRHPSDTMNDAPVSFGKWHPGNYEDRYDGEITLTRAFAKSSNSVAAQLAVESGPRAVVGTAHRLGIRSDLLAVPSIGLGSATVTPIELTGAYVPFANGGERAPPFAILEIRSKSGHVLYRRRDQAKERVMTPGEAAEMAQFMTATVESGTGKAARLPERPSAGKTGTTQDYRDAWFVGFTSDYVCGVWIGNDNNSPMVHATGGTLPARIFKSYMEEAEAGRPARQLTSIRLAPPPPPPVAAAAPAASAAATEAARSAEKPSAFERLLDSLFGGH